MKILTIDFDIITSRSIHKYGEYENKIGSEFGFKEIEKAHPELSKIDMDLHMFYTVSDYLEKNKHKNIIFINEHHEIVFYVPEDEDYEIFNIDHHDDLVDGNYDHTPEVLNCGNWAYLLMKYGRLKHYVIGHDDDMLYCDKLDVSPTCLKGLYISGVGNLDTYLNNYDPDLIVVCASYNYVPPRYWHLFNEWKKIVGVR